MATRQITVVALIGAATALAVVVLLLTTPWSASPSSGSDLVQGNVDCDADVDSVDALFDLKFVAGIEPFGDCTEEAGDTDCSGDIGATDALHILRFVAGFASTTPDDCTPIGTRLGEPPTPTESGAAEPTDTPGASPSPGVTATPTPAAEPTVTPTPGPTGAPITYGMEFFLFDEALGDMIDFDVIPGTNGEEAVVITQGGTLWRISLTDAFDPQTFGDIEDLILCCSEEGLLSIVFSPDFTEDDIVYLYYSRLDTPGDNCDGSPRCSFISQFTVAANVMNPAPTVVMEIGQPFNNHNGGKLLFGPDGFLYLGLGDGGGDGGANGQDTTTVLGSIIRIDPQPGGGYTIPAGNPFADEGGGDADEIWAYGMRKGAEEVPNLALAVGEHLPYADETFDVVVLHEVLEHVTDDVDTLRETARVLRKGGRAIVFTPNRTYPFETHGIFVGKRYVFGNIPFVNYLPDLIRNRLVPHARVYTTRKLRRVYRKAGLKAQLHSYVFPGFDHIMARHKIVGRALRLLLYPFEHTPLRIFGLSHFVVLAKA